MVNSIKKIADLDFNFIPHPVSGDIVPLKDIDAVKRSVRNLMLTGQYERLFQPNKGANLKQLLFEPINPLTETSIQLAITGVINAFEPRVKIISLKVKVSADENGYNVTLVFAVDQVSEFATVDFFLERLR
jgi:phage baseplate assembly protein W